MSNALKTAMGIVGLVVATQAAAQVTFYSREGFRGQSFTADRNFGNLERQGFNDRASSAVVRGGNWQVCEDSRFEGRCAVLQPGEYPSLASMGLGNEISSVRPVEGRYGYNDDRRYIAQGDRDAGRGDYRRRGDERLFEAQVTSVHAVVGPPEQRCWVERRDFTGNATVPGAIAGAVIGGILGTRSAADTARTSRRRAVQWPARPSAATSAAMAAFIVRTCSVVPRSRTTTVRITGT